MTKEFQELMNKDKTELSEDELMTVMRLHRIKKSENTLWTDLALITSPLIIILCIINLFTPIFATTFGIILNYLATIPAFLNIAIKIREIVKKKIFMKEFDISRKEMKNILKSDQMKVFEELIKDINRNVFYTKIIVKRDNTFEDFEFKEPMVGLDLTPAKSRVAAKKQNKLIKRIVKNNKGKNIEENNNEENNNENNLDDIL